MQNHARWRPDCRLLSRRVATLFKGWVGGRAQLLSPRAAVARLSHGGCEAAALTEGGVDAARARAAQEGARRTDWRARNETRRRQQNGVGVSFEAGAAPRALIETLDSLRASRTSSSPVERTQLVRQCARNHLLLLSSLLQRSPAENEQK
eukprot:2577232-Pleurochrysis_carterae.AAC.2